MRRARKKAVAEGDGARLPDRVGFAKGRENDVSVARDGEMTMC